MKAKIIAERKYKITGETEEDVVFRVFAPVETIDSGFCSAINVISSSGVREYRVAFSEDAWGAIDAAFRFARILIVRLHESGSDVFLGDKRSQSWL